MKRFWFEVQTIRQWKGIYKVDARTLKDARMILMSLLSEEMFDFSKYFKMELIKIEYEINLAHIGL